MKFEDYKQAVLEDATQYLTENLDSFVQDDYADPFDVVFESIASKSYVTGEQNGSYTNSSIKAKENLSEVIWQDEFWSALDSFDYSPEQIVELFKSGPERMDATIRAIVLNNSYTAIEEIYNDMI